MKLNIKKLIEIYFQGLLSGARPPSLLFKLFQSFTWDRRPSILAMSVKALNVCAV